MGRKTETAKSISGLELVRNVIDAYRDNPVQKLLELTHGETEYLELKGKCVFDKNDTARNKPGETQNDLSWNIAREILALYNTKGGVLIIGIDDHPPFNLVPLPDFAKTNRNDYLRRMVEDKIFPSFREREVEWSTKNGAERYSCATDAISQLRRNSIHMEYLPYQGGEVVAIFVDPAPCQSNSCISVSFSKNQGDSYDQIPVRHTGNSGGVDVLTKDEEKHRHERTRHRVSSEFARQWKQWRPQEEGSSTGTKSCRKLVPEASAAEGCDPSNDPLIRSLEGRRLETEFTPGEYIAGYKVLGRIGQGGMGIVYEVEHPSLMTHRALKVFSPSEEEEDSDILKRKFLAEARLLALFNHPGLVRVHTIGVAPMTATLYYEMDFIRSANNRPRTLQDVFNDIKDNPPTNRQLKHWFSQLCAVLDYLHREKRIVHRDIKLGNILLNERGFAILSDFGIARIRDKELNQLLGEGKTINPDQNGIGDARIGTPEYLAPELDKNKATAKTDIFALGVVFFKLLTGTNYHQECGDDLKACLRGKPRFWRKTLPKLLARNPVNRIDSLSKYEARIIYPYVSIGCWLLRLLALYAVLHLVVAGIHIWHARDKAASLDELWPVRDSVAALRDAERELHSDDTDAPITLGHDTKPGVEPSPSIVQDFPVIPRQQANDSSTSYSLEEVAVAESDLRQLTYRSMTPKRKFLRFDDISKDDWLSSEINTIHGEVFEIWRATKELTDLGMRIDEIQKSRKDLIYKCIDVRRKAQNKINNLIGNADYKKALKLYTSVNDEFRMNGFEIIPRPSFTPGNSNDEESPSF